MCHSRINVKKIIAVASLNRENILSLHIKQNKTVVAKFYIFMMTKQDGEL